MGTVQGPVILLVFGPNLSILRHLGKLTDDSRLEKAYIKRLYLLNYMECVGGMVICKQ